MHRTRTRTFLAALLAAAGAPALCHCGTPGADAVRPAADSTDSAMRMSPPAGDGVLRANIVRSRTGRPIPGTLTVTGPGGLVRSSAAGPDGSVRVDGLPRNAILDAVATSPGLLPLPVIGIRLWPGGDDSLGMLNLGEAVPLEIFVTYEDQRPAAGVRFEVHDALHWTVPSSTPPPVATATTGKDGRAVVTGVPPGRWQAVIRAPGYGTEAWSIELVEGALREPLRVQLDPAHRLEGRLLDAGGRPMAGMELVFAHDSWGPFDTTTTDAEGRFRFEDLVWGMSSVSFRRSPGVLEILHEFQVPVSGPAELRMLPRGEIRGRVLDDATGLPVSGARVSVQCWGEPRGDGWTSGRGKWIGTAEPAETAADGTFLVRDVPLGPDARPGDEGCLVSSIGVYGEGYLYEWIPRQGREGVPPCVVAAGSPPSVAKLLEVSLRQGTTVLRGVVRTRDGRPVPGAWISLGLGDPRGEWWKLEATADAEGRYRMPPALPGAARISAGAFMLHLEGMGHFGYEEPIHPDRLVELPSSGEVVRDLVLVPDSAVEGRMVLADGRPAAGYIPVLTHQGGGTRTGDSGLPSAEDGSFRIEELSAEEGVAVKAEGPRGTVGTSPPFDIAESARVSGVVVRVVLPASVSGRVVGPDGGPIAESWVRLRSRAPGDRDDWGSGLDVDADGNFLAEDLKAGNWEAVAYAPGRLPSLGARLDLAEGEKRTGLVLALREGASIEGRVLDAAGEPVGGAFVGAFAPPRAKPFVGSIIIKPGGPQDAEQTTESAPDGTFRITGLEEKPYDVAAWKEGLLGSSRSPVAGERGVDLRVRRPSFVSGVVVDPSGKPLEGATVELVAPERTFEAGPGPDPFGGFYRFGWLLGQEEGWHRAHSGEDGTFRVDAPEGECRLVARMEGFAWGVAVARAPAEEVRIAVRKPMAISGRVTGPDGATVAGAWILARALTGHGEDGWTQSGEDGTFLLEGLAPEAYGLLAENREANVVPAEQEVVVQAGGKDVEVRTREGLRFRARFLYAGGGSPSVEEFGVLVEETADGERRWHQPELGEDGAFTLSGLGPCTLRLFLVRHTEPIDIEDPPAASTFGPFEVPGPERTITLER